MKMVYSFLALALFFSACRSSEIITPAPGEVYPGQHRGKVLFDVCGNIAVQITDGTQRGQMGWRHGADTPVYDRVFRVMNPCTWNGSGMTDIVFSFAAPDSQRCAQCLAWTATPDSAYFIRVIK